MPHFNQMNAVAFSGILGCGRLGLEGQGLGFGGCGLVKITVLL